MGYNMPKQAYRCTRQASLDFSKAGGGFLARLRKTAVRAFYFTQIT